MSFADPLISLAKFANKGGQITVFTNRENSNREVVVLGDYTGLVQETYSSGCPNLGQVHGT